MDDLLRIKRLFAILLVLVFFITTSLLLTAALAFEEELQVQCNNGEWIYPEWVNDGYNDCGDWSDESPAAESWPEELTTNSSATWCWPSFILFVIFGLWASKLEKEINLENLELMRRSRSAEAQRKIAEADRLRKERAQQRAQQRQVMRQEANERERALDYDSAIRIWEELGQIKEAARVRKLKARQSAIKVDQTVIHGDYVDDRDTTYIDDRDTIVKDSVISKSSIGAGGDDKLTKIKELKELHDAGAIDTAEFQQMKKEILGK